MIQSKELLHPKSTTNVAAFNSTKVVAGWQVEAEVFL